MKEFITTVPDELKSIYEVEADEEMVSCISHSFLTIEQRIFGWTFRDTLRP